MIHERTKKPSEVITYQFKFARTLEETWQPGQQYSAADYVRPPHANGFEYECTDGGQTAQDEPDWPLVIANTVDDGSVEWTCRDFGLDGSDTISTRTVTPDTGISVDSSSIVGTDVLAVISGGTLGQVYDILCEITTAAGAEYAETLRITLTE